MSGLTYSLKGLALTERFEADAGPSLTAYADKLAKGKPTVGWGHTGSDVHVGAIWTREQCEQALQNDIHWAANVVNGLVHVGLTQGEFDALVDFCFNVGAHNFADSTMLALLNNKQYHDAANQFELWDHASGKVVAGLLRRRQAEEALFNA